MEKKELLEKINEEKPVKISDLKFRNDEKNIELYSLISKCLDDEDVVLLQKGNSYALGLENASYLEYKIAPSRPFSLVRTATGLKKFLSKGVQSIKGNEYLYHHTSISSLCKIIEKKQFYINSPKNMNDQYEYKKYDEKLWNNVFFMCWMGKLKENVGMWSMYSQPWEDGVSIGIRAKDLIKWFDNLKIVYESDYRRGAKDEIKNEFEKELYSVCYVKNNEDEKIDTLYSRYKANKIYKPIYDKDMLGYLKDYAWEYENEYRFRINIDAAEIYSGIVIDIPDYVLENMIIIKGPRFDEKKNSMLINKVKGFDGGKNLIFVDSILNGKLSWIPCDSCEIKKKLKKTYKRPRVKCRK